MKKKMMVDMELERKEEEFVRWILVEFMETVKWEEGGGGCGAWWWRNLEEVGLILSWKWIN